MVDEIELSKLFVRRAELAKESSALDAKIQEMVVELGESRKMAGVTATYYKPSTEMPDYAGIAKSAGLDSDNDIVQMYTTTSYSTKWKDVCEAANLPIPTGTEKPARVVVKVA